MEEGVKGGKQDGPFLQSLDTPFASLARPKTYIHIMQLPFGNVRYIGLCTQQ